MYVLRSFLFLFVATGVLTSALAQAPPPRTAFVHLFEWTWDDVAQECEDFLGPAGYAAVQVSPPQEHAVLADRPWYERYQPVSYRLTSRSGNRAAFAAMVARCKAVGVDIYVDAVINHMSSQEQGTGTDGTQFSHFEYPGLFNANDFHHCGRYGNDDIRNYQDRWEVQNCELLNLPDLRTETDRVRDTVGGYLNDLVSLGVAGFRIDASKHMPAGDIMAILNRVAGNPYVFQEVIDQGGEPISAHEYFQNGDVTEFKYSRDLSRMFFEGKLAWLHGQHAFGEGWAFMPGHRAVVFVDNHDNQRGHGGGGHILTHKDSTRYVLANVFMLAWPYGYPKVMSSYAFEDDGQGPPTRQDGSVRPVHDGGALHCFGDMWQCEHRWPALAAMARFRNVTAPAYFVSHWWSNGENQIAFGRGDRGFVAINHENQPLDQTLSTGLPPGVYCDVVNGTATPAGCTGPTVTVAADGSAHISVPPMQALAIHVDARQP